MQDSSIPPSPPPPAPSRADIHAFLESHAALAVAIAGTEGGAAALFERKSTFPYTGMSNQGATCYLNSLLQALFFVAPFREAVLHWRFDAARHGAAADCIPLQLQRVFARLAYSPRASVSTALLTRSFGWAGDEAFAQHDVQELMRVLFEALQLADCDWGVRREQGGGDPPTNFGSLIPELFEGRCRDTLRCSVCGFSRSREDAFLDITLTVKSNSAIQPSNVPNSVSEKVPHTVHDGTELAALEVLLATATLEAPFAFEPTPTPASCGPCTPYTSLHRSLRAHLASEVLSGADQWQCSGACGGAKVDAFKTLELAHLPPVLTLHLKRFSFDARSGRYSKICDAFSFPLELDADAFSMSECGNEDDVPAMSATAAAVASVRAPEPPTAIGSGRSAIHALRRASLDSDSLRLLAEERGIDEDEDETRELSGEEGEGRKGKVTKVSNSTFELSAILMHSGAAAQGHYYAFIREPLCVCSAIGVDMSTSSWLLVNDASVLRVTEAEVLLHSGASGGIAPELVPHLSGGKGLAADAPSGNARFVPPKGTAYLLIYQRRTSAFSSVHQLPRYVSSASCHQVSDNIAANSTYSPCELLLAYGDLLGLQLLPKDEHLSLTNEAYEWESLLQAHATRQSLCELSIVRPQLPFLDLPEEESRKLLKSAEKAASSDESGCATVLALPLQPASSSTVTIFVPLAYSVDEACDEVYSALVALYPQTRAARKLLPLRSDVRLRRFDIVSRCALDTYSYEGTQARSLHDLGFGLSQTVSLEVRLSAPIALPWPDFDPDAISVRTLLWNGNDELQCRVRSLVDVATNGAAESSNLELEIFLDGSQATTLTLPGSPPATGETLFLRLVNSILEPSPNAPSIPRCVHAILLPGGLPSPADISSGAAATLLKTRGREIVAACTRSGLRVLSFPFTNEVCPDFATLLQQECGLASGDDFIIVREDEGGESESQLATLLTMLNALYASLTVRIRFNRLRGVDTALVSATKIDLEIVSRRDETLAALKARMVAQCNAPIDGDSNPSSLIDPLLVHVRRSQRAPQIRNEGSTLRNLDIGDGATLLLAHGALLEEGAVIVRAIARALADSAGISFPHVISVQVQLSSRVGALKRSLHRALFEAIERGGMPASIVAHTPAHLRLRSLRAGTTGTILRDESTIRQALGTAGAGGDDDVREVLLQVLEKAEVVAKDDLVMRATELVHKDGAAHLTEIEDLVVGNSTTLAELAASLARSVGDEAAVSVVRLAKHGAFGPALTPWEAAHKSVFVGPFLPGDANGNAHITEQPLGLRDGYTLLWRRDAAVPTDTQVAIGETVSSKQDENAGALSAKPWLKARSRSMRSDGDFVVAMPKPRAGLGEYMKEVGVVIKVKGAGGEVVLD